MMTAPDSPSRTRSAPAPPPAPPPRGRHHSSLSAVSTGQLRTGGRGGRAASRAKRSRRSPLTNTSEVCPQQPAGDQVRPRAAAPHWPTSPDGRVRRWAGRARRTDHLPARRQQPVALESARPRRRGSRHQRGQPTGEAPAACLQHRPGCQPLPEPTRRKTAGARRNRKPIRRTTSRALFMCTIRPRGSPAATAPAPTHPWPDARPPLLDDPPAGRRHRG